VEDCLNSFLCVGWVLLTLLLIEKLMLVMMMSKIGSRHLSFASVASVRYCQPRLESQCTLHAHAHAHALLLLLSHPI